MEILKIFPKTFSNFFQNVTNATPRLWSRSCQLRLSRPKPERPPIQSQHLQKPITVKCQFWHFENLGKTFRFFYFYKRKICISSVEISQAVPQRPTSVPVCLIFEHTENIWTSLNTHVEQRFQGLLTKPTGNINKTASHVVPRYKNSPRMILVSRLFITETVTTLQYDSS